MKPLICIFKIAKEQKLNENKINVKTINISRNSLWLHFDYFRSNKLDVRNQVELIEFLSWF
jgi:hypothetical protein